MNNYHNRRKRGQCVSCVTPALPNECRCQDCKELHRQKWAESSKAVNARRRERAFQASMERERRLEEIDLRLQREVAELEKVFGKFARIEE